MDVFKGAEKKAMEVMQQARAAVQDRKEDERTKQAAFDFRGDVPKVDTYYDELRHRYTSLAKDDALGTLRAHGRCSYDVIYSKVLEVPLTFESDLKDWITAWRKSGSVVVEGLKERERVPKPGAGHFLIWSGGQSSDSG